MKPESQLINYLDRFQELYATTGFLNNSFPEEMKEIDNSFEKAISKLKLLSIIHEKYVIGVAGFQGAGKTTLMNWYLFDNPLSKQESWLPENQGVGENLPVLITVDRNIKKVEAILYEVVKYSEGNVFSEQTTVKKTIINQPAEVQKIVKHPENNHLLLELIVPLDQQLKSFNKSSVLDGTSFLLLPGYEVINDEMDEDKRYRQEYMRLALRACANSIVVLDPRMVMQREKENVLSEITEIFKDTNAIYVLSHSDEKSGIDAVTYLSDKFNVNIDRIIESGTETDTFTRSDIDNWRKHLTLKVAENVTGNNQIREIQKKNISKLASECTLLIKQIERLKEKIEVGSSDEERKLRELFKKYDESISYISENYFKIYDEKIDKLLEQAYSQLDNENHNKNNLAKIGDWLYEKFNGPEPISNISKKFIDTFDSKVSDYGGSSALLLKVFNQTQIDLGVYADLKVEGDLDNLKQDALAKTIPRTEYHLSEGIIRNIQFLAGSDMIHTGSNKLNDPDKDLDNAMRILPYLIFDSQRYQLISEGKPLLGIFKDSGHVPASDSFIYHFGESGSNVKSFLAGIASLVGADLLPDGQLDSIGSLFAELFGSSGTAPAGGAAVDGTTAAATGGSSVLGLVTGIAVGLIVLKSINDASIQHGLKKMSTLYEIKNFQRDSMKTNLRNNFYTTFQRIRNLIEFRLRKYAFNNYDLGNKLKLENRIQNCNTAGNELRESLRTES